jgi:hypothetical protein
MPKIEEFFPLGTSNLRAPLELFSLSSKIKNYFLEACTLWIRRMN